MPLFNYQAKQGPEKIIEGVIQAQSQDEAVNRLLRDGLVPMTVVIRADDSGDTDGAVRRIAVTRKERRLFTRQLTSLLRAKLELVPAVTILKDQSASRSLHALLEDMEKHMRDGHTFSEALGRHPAIFSTLFQSAIQAGEAAGKLDDILTKLVLFDEQQELLESRLRGAMAYPILLAFLGTACLGFFIWFVVPRMAGLFTQLGGNLPGPTRLLIRLSEILSIYWVWILAAAVIGGMLLRWLFRRPPVINLTERLLKQIGFSRTLLEAQQIGRFTRTLQLLLHSGLPIFQAIDSARPTLGSRLLEDRIRQAQEMVKRGESIALSLRATRCFPPLVIQMIAVGESSGTLVNVLDELASYYERLLDEQLRILTALVEPLMILVMGVLVGFCVLAMVLPVFQMTQLVR